MKDTHTNQSSFTSIMIVKLIKDSIISITHNQEILNEHSIISEQAHDMTAKSIVQMSDSRSVQQNMFNTSSEKIEFLNANIFDRQTYLIN